MDETTQLLLLIGAAATAVAGLGYLVKVVYRWAQRLDDLAEVANYQFRPNGGGSVVDKIDSTAHDVAHLKGAFTELAGQLDQLSHRFDDHVAATSEANRAMWPAVQAIAEAQPPNDRQ